jgi:hypothetical protein
MLQRMPLAPALDTSAWYAVRYLRSRPWRLADVAMSFILPLTLLPAGASLMTYAVYCPLSGRLRARFLLLFWRVRSQ